MAHKKILLNPGWISQIMNLKLQTIKNNKSANQKDKQNLKKKATWGHEDIQQFLSSLSTTSHMKTA